MVQVFAPNAHWDKTLLSMQIQFDALRGSQASNNIHAFLKLELGWVPSPWHWQKSPVMSLPSRWTTRCFRY
jgi:hypothetical protein